MDLGGAWVGSEEIGRDMGSLIREKLRTGFVGIYFLSMGFTICDRQISIESTAITSLTLAFLSAYR